MRDWSDTSANLHNTVRAISRPGPGRARGAARRRSCLEGSLGTGLARYRAIPGAVVGRDGKAPGEDGRFDASLLEVEGGTSAALRARVRIGTRFVVTRRSPPREGGLISR